MPELRWLLLILGALFIGALAWWELRRQRRTPAPPDDRNSHHFHEPSLGLPEIRTREPVPELPLVEIDDDSMLGLRVDGVRIEEDTQVAEPATSSEPEIPEERVESEKPRASARLEPEPPPEPILDWPPEGQRELLAVRVISPSEERFSGRAMRLALAAEGFVLGKFSIFHKPGPDARVVVSAASLTQPGTFDQQSMNTQHYSGLGLFTVLPGPLPAPQMFDELLATARNLNARLEGLLQDEQGEPLTAARAASLRETLEPEPRS